MAFAKTDSARHILAAVAVAGLVALVRPELLDKTSVRIILAVLLIATAAYAIYAIRTSKRPGNYHNHRSTLENAGVGIITLNGNAAVTFINTMASQLTGWEQDRAIGQPLMRVFTVLNPDTRLPLSESSFGPLDPGSRPLTSEALLVVRNGTQVAIDFTINSIESDNAKNTDTVIVFHATTERNNAEAALKASEERYRELFENSSDILFTYDLDGTLTSLNKIGEQAMGLPREKMIGRSLWRVMNDDQQKLAKSMRELKLAGEPETSYELEIRTPDGRELVLDVCSRLIVENGTPVGMQGSARDITERKNADKEREQLLARERAARAEAEAANRSKDEFLATVSHELRTPLSAILGWAHMLRHSRLDTQTTERALETIERNARSQAQIVEDILDVSRIITGKLRLDVSPVELAPVVEAAIDAVRPAADAKGITICANFDGATGPVSIDPNRIQQVVWNLLSNAVKFTPRGGNVFIDVVRTESHAEISVRDTGQGISSDFLPFVFDRFRQADGTRTRKHSGLGLGLAIVKYMVEMHGGSVVASSPGEGLGASFKVSVPLSSRDAQLNVNDRDSKPALVPIFSAPSLAGLKVLVVDDEADTREVLKAMLLTYDAQVTVCGSTPEAMEAVAQLKPNVIISDIEMPGHDGYELISRIRALEKDQSGQVPAIALTAYGSVADRLRSLAAGYQLHIAKPVDAAELAAAVAGVATHNRSSSSGS